MTRTEQTKESAGIQLQHVQISLIPGTLQYGDLEITIEVRTAGKTARWRKHLLQVDDFHPLFDRLINIGRDAIKEEITHDDRPASD